MNNLSKNSVQEKKSSINANSRKYTPRPLKLWHDIDSQQEVRIEIVPMIDVIFCILTFFILAAVGFSRQQAISLNLPKASTGEAQMRDMLLVSLDQQGQLYLEKQPVSQIQLYSALRTYNSLNPSGLMVLHASEEVRYSQVVEILDMLKEVGGSRVALATLADNPTQLPENTLPNSGINPYLPPTQNSPTIPTLPPTQNLPTIPNLPTTPNLPPVETPPSPPSTN